MNMDEKPLQAEIIMITNIRVLRQEPAWTASLERNRMRRVRHEAEQVIKGHPLLPSLPLPLPLKIRITILCVILIVIQRHWIVLSWCDECDVCLENMFYMLKGYWLLGNKCFMMGQEKGKHVEAGRKQLVSHCNCPGKR